MKTLLSLSLVVAWSAASANELKAPPLNPAPAPAAAFHDGAPSLDPLDPSKQTDSFTDAFDDEVWGRTHYGDGYVYGPTFGSMAVSVVDIDRDSDHDLVFRSDFRIPPQLMRNLGTTGAFYPGGQSDLAIPDPPGASLWVTMEFGDVTGDRRPDLVAIAIDYNTDQTFIVAYKNDGPRNNPAFTYIDTLYTSPQITRPEIIPSLADLDSDGLVDIVFMEPFLDRSSGEHAVFFMKNTGTASIPSWGNAVEITALSNLLPPGARKTPEKALNDADRSLPSRPKARGKAGTVERVTDIEIADWDIDGLLDLIYYDALGGLYWVENTGTTANPQWDSISDSLADFFPDLPIPEAYTNGSFAIRTNPDAFLDSAEWLDDIFISAGGELTSWRYFVSSESYRLTQETALAYFSGQGPPSFWDYDGDGDLDLFRGGVGGASRARLLLFPNVGTPYDPAWGDFAVIQDDNVIMSIGTVDNEYRQDLHTFADIDNDGDQDLFIQRQDGSVDWFYAQRPTGGAALPTFVTAVENLGSLAPTDRTGVQPRGLAVADFDLSPLGRGEIITAYASDQGAGIVYYDFEGGTVTDMTVMLRDSAGEVLNASFVESLATADLNRDGRPDLIVTTSWDIDHGDCEHHAYLNTAGAQGAFSFNYAGLIQAPQDVDNSSARMIEFADIDADSDPDLFIGHQRLFTNSRLHYLRFYRNGADTQLAYWRTRVVTGQTWLLRWRGGLPLYEFVANSSGGVLGGPGSYTAGGTARVVDIVESTDLTKNVRVFVDVLPEVAANESKAIVVLGSTPGDPLYETFGKLASYGYWVLLQEGLPSENIRFFAASSFDPDEDGVDDVYAAPSLSGLEESITQWASGVDRLLVYFIDHGQRNRFRLTDTVFLQASEYAGWLDTLQPGGAGPQVTTLIDMCEAGSFLDELALTPKAIKQGAERITMTSSHIGPLKGLALFDTTQQISFSLSFWTEIFNGGTYGEAFDTAKISIQAINPLQVPQIDDGGNGIGNEQTDGLLARSVRPGASFDVGSPSLFIGQVAPPQAVSSNSTTLWLSDVVSSFPVEGAGALIVAPNVHRPTSSSDDEQPITGLVWTNFTFSETLERWQGNYTGFDEGGLYRVQYFVKALGRYYASPRIGFVDRINLADAWESDDTPGAAKWLSVNNAQGHNFHDAGDVDWVRFSSPRSQTATIAVISPRHNSQPVVRLYRKAALDANPNAAPLIEAESASPGAEVVFDYTFSQAEQYLLRVANADAALYGEGTSYLLIVAIDTGGDLVAPTLIVSVLERGSNDPVGGAEVSLDTVTIETTSDGIAQFTVSADGLYPIAVAKSGYVTLNDSVIINNIVESRVFLLDTGSGGEGEGEGGCAAGGIGFLEGQGADSFGDLLLILLTLTALALGRRSIGGGNHS